MPSRKETTFHAVHASIIIIIIIIISIILF